MFAVILSPILLIVWKFGGKHAIDIAILVIGAAIAQISLKRVLGCQFNEIALYLLWSETNQLLQ